MPTGYTEIIERGATFEQYVWRCARGMGALIMMRDDALNAPIPQRFEPDTSCYDATIAKAQSRLRELRGMKPEAVQAAADAAHAAAVESIRASNAHSQGITDAYVAMRKRVVAWDPPADHAGLKRFMLDQIDLCLEHRGPIREPKRQAPRAWLAEQLAAAERDIAYGTERRDAEIARAAERNAWIAALRESVPVPAQLEPPAGR